MQKQSKSVCQCNTSNASLRQRAANALKPIRSSDPVVHMRNQQILLVLVADLLEKLDHKLQARR